MKAVEFCDIAGANKRDRFVIEHLYRNVDASVSKWKTIIKNDFRSINVNTLIEPDVKKPDTNTSNKKANTNTSTKQENKKA